MLVSKTVKIKWINPTRKHYENLGYKYTGYHTDFEVNVEDLTFGSGAKIDVICDDCGILCNPSYGYYKKHSLNGKYYCKTCANKNKDQKSITKSLIRKGFVVDFESWAVNNKPNALSLWDYELNDILPSEVSHTSNNRFFFKCHNSKHSSSLRSLGSIVAMHKISDNEDFYCKACNSIGQYLIETYGENGIKDYWGSNNTMSPWEVSIGSDETTIWIKCKECLYHDEYDTLPQNFKNGCRCPYCGGTRTHPLDSLGSIYPQSIEIWSDKNKNTPFECAPKTNDKVWWKCKFGHDDYLRSVHNAVRAEFRCPECVKQLKDSSLQIKINTYLTNILGYDVFHERGCSIIPRNPEHLNSSWYDMPFDNEIVINNDPLIIECHGIQHYQITGFAIRSAKRKHTTPEQELAYQQWKDEFKKQYAISKGYYYLEIPYWTEKDESYKTLIDNKISEILSNSCSERKTG